MIGSEFSCKLSVNNGCHSTSDYRSLLCNTGFDTEMFAGGEGGTSALERKAII